MTAPSTTTTNRQSAANTAAAVLAAATAARLLQLAIRAQLLRDVAKLWAALDVKRLDQTFPGWLQAMKLLVRSYHGQSAVAAAESYRLARSRAILSPTPQSLIKLAPTPSDEWLARAFGFSGPGMLSRDTVQPNTALSTTLGTAARIVADGGRTTIQDTVKHDPVAVGYYRITDGRPCAFCALMASRGVVYKNEMTAGRAANKRFIGDGEFKYHNMCGCDAAPAFSRDHELPEISQQAQQVYLERGKGPALQAFRKAWEEHLAQMDEPAATAAKVP